ncbi:MAG: isocitrate/isopropylmalate family dehydrogenase [Woeseiaceae bacterium]|nr:isocitrate/isopropylmalate family dehydrogenase [Woeseiaceae bacterium]
MTDFAGKDRVNLALLVLSTEMILRYLGWTEAADPVRKDVAKTIANKELTFYLARLPEAMHRPISKEHPMINLAWKKSPTSWCGVRCCLARWVLGKK